jgi:hypothetical protein
MVMETFAADSPGEVEVLLQYCYSPGVNGAKVGVFEEAGQVAFSDILKSQKGLLCEVDFSSAAVHSFSDTSYHSLEWCLAE